MISLTANELRAICAVRYPNAIGIILDGSYNVPSEESLPDFANELWNELKTKYGDKWESYNDCENFALEALVLACRKHYIARQSGAGSADGVAWGVLAVGGSLKHALNTRIRPDRTLIEYEPQTRKDTPLTPEQCAAAFFYLFA